MEPALTNSGGATTISLNLRAASRQREKGLRIWNNCITAKEYHGGEIPLQPVVDMPPLGKHMTHRLICSGLRDASLSITLVVREIANGRKKSSWAIPLQANDVQHATLVRAVTQSEFEFSILASGTGKARLNELELNLVAGPAPEVLLGKRKKLAIRHTDNSLSKSFTQFQFARVNEYDPDLVRQKPKPVSHAKTLMFVSIDTEDTYFNAPLQITGNPHGLPASNFIMDTLEKHDMRGIFFVNVYEHKNYPDDGELREAVREIALRGHELALHSHESQNLEFYTRQLPTYDLAAQTRIIDYGASLLSNWSGQDIVSFRAGGYKYNKDTIRALEKNGIRVDSSYCRGLAPADMLGTRHFQPYKLRSLIEAPVTYIPLIARNGTLLNSKFDINALRANELSDVLDFARSAKPATLNMMMHSFSFMKKVRYREREVGIGDSGVEVIDRSPLDHYGGYVEIQGVREQLMSDFDAFLHQVKGNDQIVVKTYNEAYEELSELASNPLTDQVPFVYR